LSPLSSLSSLFSLSSLSSGLPSAKEQIDKSPGRESGDGVLNVFKTSSGSQPEEEVSAFLLCVLLGKTH